MFDLFNSIEIAVNRLLPLDPAAEKRISKLNGKSVSIAITNFALEITMVFTGGRVAVIEGFDPNASACLEGSFQKIVSLTLFRSDSPVIKGVRISGDRELLIELQQLIKELDIDWEEPLSHLFGDVAAHQIGAFSRKIFHWTKNTANTLALNSQNYVNNELSTTVRQTELESFLSGVDTLSADTERLQVRIAKLEQTITSQRHGQLQSKEERINTGNNKAGSDHKKSGKSLESSSC